MKNEFTLLIADSNPHVRSFLQRELAADGYQVKSTGTAKAIFVVLWADEAPDLLIMDLDMPLEIGLEVLRRLYNFVPRTPVIIYTHLTEYQHHPQVQWVDAFIEKNGSPIPLKEVIADVLHSYYAHCID